MSLWEGLFGKKTPGDLTPPQPAGMPPSPPAAPSAPRAPAPPPSGSAATTAAEPSPSFAFLGHKQVLRSYEN